MIIRPYITAPKIISVSIPNARSSKHLHISRRTIQSPRPKHFPAPRTPHPNHPPMMESVPESGYRHATAKAVDYQP